MVSWRLRVGTHYFTMWTLAFRCTRLFGAGSYLEFRAHRVAAVALAFAIMALSQQLAMLGAALPRLSLAQPAVSNAEAGVRETLQKYSAALESLDPQAVKKVQPSIPIDNLAKAFKDMRELKVDIDEIRVLSTEGSTARVSCRVKQTLTPKAGSKQTTAVTRVMRLRREANSWVIDGFER